MSTLPAGTYRIINQRSGTTVRSYSPGPVYVASSLEYPGPYDQWEIGDDGSIRNVGLDMYLSVDSNGKVVTGPNQDTFSIERVFELTYVITTGNNAKRARDADKVWNVDPPVIPRGTISIQPRNGLADQTFTFANIPM